MFFRPNMKAREVQKAIKGMLEVARPYQEVVPFNVNWSQGQFTLSKLDLFCSRCHNPLPDNMKAVHSGYVHVQGKKYLHIDLLGTCTNCQLMTPGVKRYDIEDMGMGLQLLELANKETSSSLPGTGRMKIRATGSAKDFTHHGQAVFDWIELESGLFFDFSRLAPESSFSKESLLQQVIAGKNAFPFLADDEVLVSPGVVYRARPKPKG